MGKKSWNKDKFNGELYQEHKKKKDLVEQNP